MLKTTILRLSFCVAASCVAASGAGLAWGKDAAGVEDLMARVISDNIDTRYAARSEAPAVGAAAVAPLAGLIDETAQPVSGGPETQRLRREIAITARAALENIVHHAGRAGADAERRAVAGELMRLDANDGTVFWRAPTKKHYSTPPADDTPN